MDFYERLKLECQKNNTTVTALLKEFGINTARTSSWKKGGKTNPSEVKLFADRLNVSTEYLLTGQEYNPDNHITLSKEEIEFIKEYRYLSEKSKSEIRNTLNHLFVKRKVFIFLNHVDTWIVGLKNMMKCCVYSSLSVVSAKILFMQSFITVSITSTLTASKSIHSSRS